MDKISDAMLWDYADGFLSDAEKAQIEAILNQNPAEKARLLAIQGEKMALLNVPLVRPKGNFADKVMAAWVVEQHQTRVAKIPEKDWAVVAIAAIFGLFVVAAISLMLVAGRGSMGGSPAFPMAIPQALQQFDVAAALRLPGLIYTFYLGLTYMTLRLVERFVQKKFGAE